MSVPQPESENSDGFAEVGASGQNNQRSNKRFLTTTASRLGFAVAMIGLCIGGVWLVRDMLSTLAIKAFLRQQGVSAAIDIENLQLGSARIIGLRLGPPDAPTLTAESIVLHWRIDNKANLVRIEKINAAGAVLRLAVKADGTLDFGALAPFLRPATGAKRVSLEGVTLSDALLLTTTPFGLSRSRITVSGGEAKGWTGFGALGLPAGLAPPEASSNRPLRAGFSIRPNAARTTIGFAIRPESQNIAHNGMAIFGLKGKISGQISLGNNNQIAAELRPGEIMLDQIRHPNMTADMVRLSFDAAKWQQNGAWHTSGMGALILRGQIGSASFQSMDRGPNMSASASTGATAFNISLERDAKGTSQATYNLSGAGVSGRQNTDEIGFERLQLSGEFAGQVKDLRQLRSASLSGRQHLAARNMVLSQPLRQTLAGKLPLELRGELDGKTTFAATAEVANTPTGISFTLAGPVIAQSDTTAQLTWLPNPQTRNFATIAYPTAQQQAIWNGSLDGRLSARHRAFGELSGRIEQATLSKDLFQVRARDLLFQSSPLLTQRLGLSARGTFNQLELSSAVKDLGSARGTATGSVSIIGGDRTQNDGSAELNFSLRGSEQQFGLNATGRVNGFGRILQIGSTGVASGQMRAEGNAFRRGSQWQGTGIVEFAAPSVAGQEFRLTRPQLNANITGSYNPSGRSTASLRVKGASGLVGLTPTRTANDFQNVDVTSNVSINGTPHAINFGGDFLLRSAGERAFGFVSRGGSSATTFSGRASARGVLINGNTNTSLNQLRQNQSGQTIGLDVRNASIVGPFSFASSNLPQLRGTFKVKAERFGVGSNVFQGLEANVPLTLSAPTRSTNLAAILESNLSLSARQFTNGETALAQLRARGRVEMTVGRDGDMGFGADNCLVMSARNGAFAGNARTGGVSGELCPDARGRLIAITKGRSAIFAQPTIEPLTIQVGNIETGQRVDLGEITGTISSRADGSAGLDLLATQFGFAIRLPDGTEGIIKANEASLQVQQRDGQTVLIGRIGRVSSLGLPVFMTGGADADMTIGEGGLSGTFKFDDIVIRDIEKSPRFGETRLSGVGQLRANQLTIQGDLTEPASRAKLAGLVLSHDISMGAGRVNVTATDVLLSPTPIRGREGLDIVNLVPPLRGVVLDMVGVVDGRAEVVWRSDAPVASSASVSTKGLDFETLLGPVSALAGTISFEDLLKVQTAGRQTLTIAELNTGGIPILDGTINFALPGDNSLRLEDARWPFADGTLSVRPATWQFRDGDQNFAIDVENVDLAKLLRLTDVPNLEIDGRVSGVFPIEVRNGDVEIVGGRLRARDGGGMIRYTGPNPSPPPPPLGFIARTRERLFGKAPPKGADLAIEALRALEYKILEITVDGRITGELKLGVILQGANQQVLAGQPFKFNVRMNVPIGQLLDNINRFNNMGNSPEVLQELDRAMQQTPTNPPSPLPPPQPPR